MNLYILIVDAAKMVIVVATVVKIMVLGGKSIGGNARSRTRLASKPGVDRGDQLRNPDDGGNPEKGTDARKRNSVPGKSVSGGMEAVLRKYILDSNENLAGLKENLGVKYICEDDLYIIKFGLFSFTIEKNEIEEITDPNNVEQIGNIWCNVKMGRFKMASDYIFFNHGECRLKNIMASLKQLNPKYMGFFDLGALCVTLEFNKKRDHNKVYINLSTGIMYQIVNENGEDYLSRLYSLEGVKGSIYPFFDGQFFYAISDIGVLSVIKDDYIKNALSTFNKPHLKLTDENINSLILYIYC